MAMTRFVCWATAGLTVLAPMVSASAADFDGDGFGDLAIGVAQEDLGSVTDAGAVNVLYGSSGGLAAAGNQVWSRNSGGVIGLAEPDDLFGFRAVAGDFNNDGRDELAIGAANETGGYVIGDVHVLKGSPSGLLAAGNQFWTATSPGIAGSGAEVFFAPVAVGNFDGDPFDDLVIRSNLASGDDDTDSPGAINVLYGSFGGLTTARNQFWSQNSPGVIGLSENGDDFGATPAVGDFNQDGRDDIAIGVPGRSSAAIRVRAPSTCCTGRRAASPREATSSGPGTAPGSWASLVLVTSSASRWRPATSTGTATTTS